MANQRVTFGEWLPDQPGVVGALTVAENVYPRAVGYGPFPSEVDFSQAASENLNNVVAARDSTGSTKLFSGGATKLFLLNPTTFGLDDVSGSAYSTSDRWRFTQFGNSLIAANGLDKLQRYDLTTTANFANLSSDAPTARYVTVVRDFVVAGYPVSYPNRVQWSGINNESTWTSSPTTQADYQDIPDGGVVQGITGGEFGLVLMDRSIHRMTYVGTPLVFQFDNISRNRGCYEPSSIIQWEGITYFLSDDGFYACDGQNIVNIGAEKVNRFFFDDMVESKINNMSAAVDPGKNLVMWGYPAQNNAYKVLVYHVPTKRWSVVETTVSQIAASSTPAYTLEALDNFSASLDAITISLDARTWLGGKLQLAGVKDNKIVTFSGTAKTAQIETSDLETNFVKSMITLVRPIVDEGSATISVASRQRLDESVTFGSSTAADSENRVGVRSFGRYHRIRTEPSGATWSSAIGVDLEIQPAGSR